MHPNQPTKRQAKYHAEKERIIILFPFNRDLIKNVKTIPGRKYHPKGKKFWSAPLSLEAVNKLEDLGFELDPYLLEFRDKKTVNVEDMTGDYDIPGLGGTLFPFQAKGVNFIDARDGRALVGDEMGLGKTVQALAWLQKHPEARPAIIICPASLKLNWAKEAKQWMSDPKIEVLHGTTPYPVQGEILIINYDIIKHWMDELIALDPKTVVMDEVHYIKNNKSQRTKAAKKICKTVPHVIGLTGTPIVNRPVEIINAVQVIDKTVIPNRWSFLHRYCGATHNGFGWDFNGASNTKELHEKLTNTVMIRRKKKDVLKDLPDKIRSFVPMELNNSKEYAYAENDFVNFIKDKTETHVKDRLREQLGDMADLVTIDQAKLNQMKQERASKANMLTQIEELKQLAVKGKMPAAINWIDDFLNSGEKLVVMATHKFVINQLMEKFGDIAVKVDGSVTGDQRQEAVDQFQNNPKVQLFVGNMQAAGVGLTLTAASNEVILELPWSPGDLSQVMDRIHRIGQKDTCNYYFLLAEDTIEERIAGLLDTKTKILDAVLDGEETSDESLISELINGYR